MELLNTPLDWAGGIIIVLCLILFTASAFEKGSAWGLSVLFLFPIGGPLFLIRHWKEVNYWFYGLLIGYGLIFLL